MSESVCLVLCTCPRGEPAAALARALVEQRLAACVNVLGDLRSIYRWQGRLEDEPEALLLIKTVAARVATLKAWIAEHHPYDVPEVLVLPVADGLEPYLDWVAAGVE